MSAVAVLKEPFHEICSVESGRNIWIHTMLMSCDTSEWHSLRKGNRVKHTVLMCWFWGEARCLQLNCHSQGDTVLVGGPAGEKGNKGETVSEHTCMCQNVYHTITTAVDFHMLWTSLLFYFRVIGDPKVCREKKGQRVKRGLQGSR